jgi:sulfite reductase (NADPH) flavoprotein alpha-component
MPLVALDPVLDTALPALAERREPLARLLEGLDGEALWWLSGYFAGLARSQPGVETASAPQRGAAAVLTVVYGSQTGNARRVAEALHARAEAEGFSARLIRASDYSLRELGNERLLALVISTHGDGDPPDDSRALLEALDSKRAPKLAQLQVAVLGLGDSSYPKFCAVAHRIDTRLAELGARRLASIGECDVDVDTVAAPWRDSILNAVRASVGSATPLATVTPIRPLPSQPNRDRPFVAELLLNQRITAADARKDVRHIELSLARSGLSYQPGDSLGIWPRNPRALVDAVLGATALAAESVVAHGGKSLGLAAWLTDELEITRIGRRFVAQLAALARAEDLDRRLAPGAEADLAAFLAEHQLIDLLLGWPAAWSAEELVAALRPLTPRLYSIASSQAAVGDEVHLTVAVVDYEAHGRRHGGAASGFLATLEGDAAAARVFIEPNERFRLPADATRDIIMVGPGTGVAPFRAFVQQRAADGARGRNWLFFGEQHFASQFLYQTEWQEALKRGQLTRLDLAFSRDQAERIYVQQRLREQGAELNRWLEGGAHLYVCGDAQRMAPDVHAALIEVIARERGIDTVAAGAVLERLAADGRYLRDVY